MIHSPPIPGATYYPVFEDEVEYWRQPRREWDFDRWEEVTVTPHLTVAEVGRAYTVDGKAGSAPDGGYEILASDGAWYDCYWSWIHSAWVYSVPAPVSPYGKEP